jgi:hypothetical protein
MYARVGMVVTRKARHLPSSVTSCSSDTTEPARNAYLQGFLAWAAEDDPQSSFSLRGGELGDAGGKPDFEAVLAKAVRNRTCAVCGIHLDHRLVPRSAFCSAQHREAFRHQRRYTEDPERERARARAYYWANRERVLEKAAAKRGRVRRPEQTTCSECPNELTGKQRVVCSPRCTERRFKRLHPESYAAKEARKVERRRERRAAGKT